MTPRAHGFTFGWVLSFVCLMALGLPRVSAAPGQRQDAHQRVALSDFQMNVNDYLEARWCAELHVRPGSNWASRILAIEQHAAAVQRERDGVARGNVFSPLVAMLFGDKVAGAIRAQGATGVALVRALRDRAGNVAGPVVNARFSVLKTAPLPAWLLAALPELPPSLVYRLFDRDLVLLDPELSIVVDILPGALAGNDGVRS